jgi:hypothetical protein
MFSSEDQRVDIIDDIFLYIVESKQNPVIQRAITKNFLSFLSYADVSKPFQKYLNNITVQTFPMSEIEKFQIASSDIGYVVEAHDSPVMDDRFISKFKNKD